MGWGVYLMLPGLIVCLGLTASAFGSLVLKVLIPPVDPEDPLCSSDGLVSLTNTPTVVLLLNPACGIHHMLS